MNTVNNLVDSMDSLNLKYSKGILTALLKEGKVNKKVLQPYASNTNTLDDVLDALEKDGLVTKKQDIIGRRVYEISLTSKGRLVAQKLKEADDIASGKSISKEAVSIELPEGVHNQIVKILKLDKEHKSEEDFVIDAVKDRIRKWKNENPEKG